MILSDFLSPFLVRNSIRLSWLKSQQSFCLDCRSLLRLQEVSGMGLIFCT